jgi:hypothetical protein
MAQVVWVPRTAITLKVITPQDRNGSHSLDQASQD